RFDKAHTGQILRVPCPCRDGPAILPELPRQAAKASLSNVVERVRRSQGPAPPVITPHQCFPERRLHRHRWFALPFSTRIAHLDHPRPREMRTLSIDHQTARTRTRPQTVFHSKRNLLRAEEPFTGAKCFTKRRTAFLDRGLHDTDQARPVDLTRPAQVQRPSVTQSRTVRSD